MDGVILIRYGEIGLKGQNRPEFENALVRHLRHVVRGIQGAEVLKSHGRVYITGAGSSRDLLGRLAKVPGVVAVNPAFRTERDLGAIREAVVAAAREAAIARGPSATFKIESRRSDKTFPLTSPELSKILGDDVLGACPGLTVDVHQPSFVLTVEVRSEGAYVYWDEIPGPGGLPLGTQGRGLLLISGGIDSPVAGYMAMKRGISVYALHFWSYPITSERSKDKVVRLARVLREYDPDLRLFVAPFTVIQTAIMEKCPENYRVTIMRRMMMRVASLMAERLDARAILTGENVGQVASQTLESLAAIEDAATLPVLRPLICFNKVETIAIARDIGTYDLSILPYEDCCSVFVPRHPVIRPKLADAKDAESALDVDGLTRECADRTEEVPLTR